MRFIQVFLVLLFISSSSVFAQWLTGDLTYYTDWKGNYGSCGLERSKYDPHHVAALSRHFMKLPPGVRDPNKHPLCAPQQCVEIKGNRGSVKLKISDTCAGCGDHDVDVAREMFSLLDNPSLGRVKVTWRFVNC